MGDRESYLLTSHSQTAARHLLSFNQAYISLGKQESPLTPLSQTAASPLFS